MQIRLIAAFSAAVVVLLLLLLLLLLVVLSRRRQTLVVALNHGICGCGDSSRGKVCVTIIIVGADGETPSLANEFLFLRHFQRLLVSILYKVVEVGGDGVLERRGGCRGTTALVAYFSDI